MMEKICAAVVGLVFWSVRNEFVCRQRIRVLHAISGYYTDNFAVYNQEAARNDTMFERQEEYFKTFLRFWDWGCKNILPSEDYEKIKKYLG